MTLLDKLERKLGRFALPNVTIYLVFGQAAFFLVEMASEGFVENNLALVPARVLEGEVWRLFLFLFMPPARNPIFVIFALYLLYLFGTALESHWGAFRYNVYLLIAYLATIAAACITPERSATNVYITTSVFLAFAYLYPDFQLLLFFILPIKVKWLAAIVWASYIIVFLLGDLQTQFLIQAAVLNFSLFFGKDIFQRIKSRKRRMEARAARVVEENKPFHVCGVCGITDKTHPDMDFRYCPGCRGGIAYCSEHLYAHECRQ